MSITFWIFLVIVLGICIFVFTKTVSNDAKNDYRLRDILSNSDDTVPEQKKEPEPVKNPQEYLEPEKNIYEEIAEKQAAPNYDGYSTQTHETYNQETVSQEEEKEKNISQPQEKVYYEKINDDACDIEEDYYEAEQPKNIKYKPEQKPYRRSLFDYVKTFWRGVTFTVGGLICLYSAYGIVTQVQTSNDAIIFSLWLLIGVISIK